VPLSYWIPANSGFNRIFGTRNSLFPESGEPTPGNRVPIDDLREILSPYTVGGMRLDSYAIQFLWDSLMRERPSVLMECGSGISTLVLATYAKKSSTEWERPVTVLSADQSREFASETESLLGRHSLDPYARVFQVPLNSRHTYDFGSTALAELLGQSGWDWLLIDGPFGPSGCRQWGLRDLAVYARPNARWFLDDAYRDAELEILRGWGRDSRVVVEGIVPTDSGLATGVIRGRDFSANSTNSEMPRQATSARSDRNGGVEGKSARLNDHTVITSRDSGAP
jgi:hypothetical protein